MLNNQNNYSSPPRPLEERKPFNYDSSSSYSTPDRDSKHRKKIDGRETRDTAGSVEIEHTDFSTPPRKLRVDQNNPPPEFNKKTCPELRNGFVRGFLEYVDTD